MGVEQFRSRGGEETYFITEDLDLRIATMVDGAVGVARVVIRVDLQVKGQPL